MKMLLILLVAAPTIASAAGKWRVETEVSKADDSKTVMAYLDAETPISGWLKHSTPQLTLVCRERKTQLYVWTDMPPQPEYGKHGEATILLRMDSDKARIYSANESTDRKALFLPSPIATARELSRHKALLFRFTPFNSSHQETTFDLTGMATAIVGVADACRWPK